MATNPLLLLCFITSLTLSSAVSGAAESPAPRQDLQLSGELLGLLRAEMLQIATGMQGMTLALATANWEAIEETSRNIRASYIMEKQLTPAQAEELEHALPAAFRTLDAAFHQRAEKLGAAAAARDPELVAFHLSRLVEQCAQCHTAFAPSRFPGFANEQPQAHQH